eukprot:13551954-Alexandrium_andersonii.AAC.1
MLLHSVSGPIASPSSGRTHLFRMGRLPLFRSPAVGPFGGHLPEPWSTRHTVAVDLPALEQ